MMPDGGDASGDCCPDDPNKTQPGVCGCGVPDTDMDGDGVPDCKDGCPGDKNKVQPGACGCFVLDTDTDGDGVADCIDGCPRDRTHTMPGPCGCGVPDNQPACLAHRYTFDDVSGPADAGAGAGDGGAAATGTIVDSVGGANGTAFGVTLTGSGSVTMAGGQTDQHIELPAGMISALGNNATFEAWVNWAGGAFWQRIFDFGTSDVGAGNQGNGLAFIFLTPLGQPAGGGGFLMVSMQNAGLTEAPGTALLPSMMMEHLAVVVDGGSGGDGGGPTVSLYLNGALVKTSPMTSSPLSMLPDVNNWLGKSQFAADPEFAGTYYEFRIYSSARTADQIMASFNAGPDTPPTQ
jgi:hypothetical protein